MFSKACKYAIKSTLLLAIKSESGEKLSLGHIAEAIGSPEAYTSKILQKLVKKNIILSEKGFHGGFKINGELLENLKLMDIIIAIDGPDFFIRCGLGLSYCDDANPCSIHHSYAGTREHLKNISETTFIKDMVKSIESGHSVLKI